jgi:hypothetical protein
VASTFATAAQVTPPKAHNQQDRLVDDALRQLRLAGDPLANVIGNSTMRPPRRTSRWVISTWKP